ncbi:MAG: hypothetical protein OQK69_09685 [Gammaproteobacteria bacterium]|nr:hypothetical protein [Gammaproteobacteria bacterium]
MRYSGSNELKSSSFLIQSSSDVVPDKLVQSIVEEEPAREDLSVFFGIGMTVNIVMITAFFIWGFKQWKKHDKK